MTDLPPQLAAGPPDPPSPVDRPVPREVRIASTLLLALGAVLGFNAALALIYRDDVARSAEQEMVAYVSADTVGTILVVAAIVLLVVAALLIVSGLHVRRGRQWARVLAFVAAGVVILFGATGALAGGGFLAVLLLGAGVGAVSLLMQAAVGPFFEPPTAHPMPDWHR